jgi:hypothetical protein
MRKCNRSFNAQRGGFVRHAGVVTRAANSVAKVVNDKGIQLMQNPALTGLLSRISGWYEPMTKKDEQFSRAYGGGAKRYTDGVFA